jgi:hypothetical protein
VQCVISRFKVLIFHCLFLSFNNLIVCDFFKIFYLHCWPHLHKKRVESGGKVACSHNNHLSKGVGHCLGFKFVSFLAS